MLIRLFHQFVNFLHKLFNPHCNECLLVSRCANCALIESLLESERRDKQKLLQAILDINKPVVTNQSVKEEVEYEPINTVNGGNWRNERMRLEQEDRDKARILKNRLNETRTSNQGTDELERELLAQDLVLDDHSISLKKG